MVHMLSSKNRSEFLAIPSLVRFEISNVDTEPEPTLLIKATTLSLKYFLQQKLFRIVFLRIAENWLAYGVQFEDDPVKPAVMWSLLEYDEELVALTALASNPRCFVFVFNELAINVAWTEVSLDMQQQGLQELIRSSTLHPLKETSALGLMHQALDNFHQNRLAPSSGFVVSAVVSKWNELENVYITNRISSSRISIFSLDEGGQQEEIALWLADNLHPLGAIRSPQVVEPNKPRRELADLLLSYDYGSFVLESKSLSIISRAELPSRSKLSNDLFKHIRKASKQLMGGLKNIRRGYQVVDTKGAEVSVERTKPPHAIILVPDLDLLADAEEFGGPFIRKFWQEAEAMLHFLDPAELLRVVQAAEIISSRSQNITKMMAFDYYLMERLKIAAANKTPNVEILLRTSRDE